MKALRSLLRSRYTSCACSVLHPGLHQASCLSGRGFGSLTYLFSNFPLSNRPGPPRRDQRNFVAQPENLIRSHVSDVTETKLAWQNCRVGQLLPSKAGRD